MSLQQMHLLILQNHLAERHWVEVNTRVNYPIKTALTWMQQNMVIDLDCPVTKYCVSLMSGKLCQVGIQLHVRAWNSHRIPGKTYSLLLSFTLSTNVYYPLVYVCTYSILLGPHRGVPDILAENNNQAARIPAGQNIIPTADVAETFYVAAGGHLSPMTLFGSDPLADSPELIQQRQRALEQNIPAPEELFAFTVNGDYAPFAQSLQFMIQTTIRLQGLIG